jgi:hypothetical protein
MRLSQDSDSWKASGLKRRDFRHTHDGPEVTRHVGKRRKSTKRWCRGVKGREHQPVVEQRRWYDLTLCSVCHKHLSYSWRPWR